MKKQGKKDFNQIWDTIELSVFILLGYYLLEFVFQISPYIEKIIPATIFGILLSIFAFGTIGYKTAKEKETSQAGRYGAYAGLIVGFVSAIIGLLTFYIFPDRIAQAIQQAAQAGADVSTVQTFMKVGLYANFVLSPAISAGIGALIAWISGLIFKKK